MPGIYCCAPGCSSSQLKNRELRFYRFPKCPILREAWLQNIKRSEFTPSLSHRLCSLHFENGRKSYMVRTPTIFQHSVKETKGRKRPYQRTPTATPNSVFESEKTSPSTSKQKEECASEEHSYSITEMKTSDLIQKVKQQQKEIEELQSVSSRSELTITSLENEVQKVQDQCNTYESELQILTRKWNALDKLNKELKKQLVQKQFGYESVSCNEKAFTFYTGISIQEFNTLHSFLEPDFEHMEYRGSKRQQSSETKNSKQRSLSKVNELFLILVRARTGAVGKDLAHRFDVSQSTVSRICTAWNDLLYYRFHTFMADSDVSNKEECVLRKIRSQLNGNPQLAPSDDLNTKQIDNFCIHVERAVEKVRNNQKLKIVLPNYSVATDLNKIWFICWYLANFSSQLIDQH